MDWKAYWSNKENGGHRKQSEVFLQREACEKLYHMGKGKRLLDFGCGSADLLRFYGQNFENVVGADFSASMLAMARKKLENIVGSTVTLVEADDRLIWEKVEGTFDCITSAAVVQYLPAKSLEAFIDNARRFLTKDGSLIFFDVIDPRIYALVELGFFRPKRSFFTIFLRSQRVLLRKISNYLIGRTREIGYAYVPEFFADLGEKYGFETEITWSMYYEYRFHAILRPKSQSHGV